MSRLLTSASNTLGPSTNILYMMSWIIIVTSWIFSSPEGKVWRHIRIKQPRLITPTITSTHYLINVFGFLWSNTKRTSNKSEWNLRTKQNARKSAHKFSHPKMSPLFRDTTRLSYIKIMPPYSAHPLSKRRRRPCTCHPRIVSMLCNTCTVM